MRLAMFFAFVAAMPSLAAPIPEEKGGPKPPAVESVTGALGSGSPYWSVNLVFKGDPVSLKEVHVRMALGDTPPTTAEKDSTSVIWRLASPFEVKKNPKPTPDEAVTSSLKDGNRTIGVQKYGLKAGQKYAFRVCAVDAKGNVHSLHTFTGTAIDD